LNSCCTDVASVHVVTVAYLESNTVCTATFKAPATFCRPHFSKHSALAYVTHVPAFLIVSYKHQFAAVKTRRNYLEQYEDFDKKPWSLYTSGNNCATIKKNFKFYAEIMHLCAKFSLGYKTHPVNRDQRHIKLFSTFDSAFHASKSAVVFWPLSCSALLLLIVLQASIEFE